MRATVWALLALFAQGGAGGASVGAEAVAASWQRPLPSGRGTCTLEVGGRRHDAVWLVDGVRWHLAVLDPLRAPVGVLRSDGVGLALTAGGVHRVARRVAPEALLEVPELLAGRLPLRPVIATRRIAGGGVGVVQRGAVGPDTTLLSPQGRVRVRSLVGPDGGSWLDVVREGAEALPERLVLTTAGAELELTCTWAPLGAPPPTAFALVAPAGHPVVGLGDTGLRLLARGLSVPR